MIKFTKMHGLGNDFVVIDCREVGEMPPREAMAAMTHRKTGVGCDQLIPILPPQDPVADVFMRIINAPNATEAQACGNATRCVADILMTEKGTDEAVVQTVAGLLYCRRGQDGRITVDMGVPKLKWSEIPLSHDVDTLYVPIDLNPSPTSLTPGGEAPLPSPLREREGPRDSGEGEGSGQSAVAVNMGNPHCVFFVKDIESVDLETVGPKIENDPLFPQKTNVEFVEVKGRQNLRMRVWERGTGITQACGTGACASVVAAIRRNLTDRAVTVTLDGGDLHIAWPENEGPVFMTGPVAYVFDGKYKTL